MPVDRSYERRQREAYRSFRDGKDEVVQWMHWDYLAKSWMQKHRMYQKTSIHHIHGRGARRQYHFFCNLICVSDCAHECGHQQMPVIFEICCLRSKMAAEQERIAKKEPENVDSERRIWMPDVMATNVGRASLSGRVEELISRLSRPAPVIERFAQEILAFL